MSNKIKLKSLNDTINRDDVLSILKKFVIRCSRVNKVGANILLLYCNDSSDVDKLFSPECTKELKQLKCELIVPPDLKAKKSIIVKQVDSYVYDQNIDAIRYELEKENDWLSVNEIFKFPKSRNIKLTFANQNMVTLALSRGLLMFHLSITPSFIVRDEYVNVLICYKCYKWNDHLTESCSKPSTFKICSLCSSEDHTFKDCKVDTKKCINCSGCHSTISVSCPSRKNIVKLILLNRKSNSSIQPQPAPIPTVTQPDDINSRTHSPPWHDFDGVIQDGILRSAMCIIVSSLGCNGNRVDYENSLNSLLKANNLPSFNMGDNPPPIINLKHISNESVPTPCSSPREPTVKPVIPMKSGAIPKVIAQSKEALEVGSPSFSGDYSSSTTVNSMKDPKKKMLSSDSPVAAAVVKFSNIDSNASDSISTDGQRKLRYSRKNK